MLVLTRKLGETIRVGDNVTLTVLDVRGGNVKVGIEAPAEVRILRGELPNWTKASLRANPARIAAGKTRFDRARIVA
ncbi:MAG: carbon storage regulator [Pirellulales bacterium]